MSREVTEAHYLHERSGLEPVLQPPVRAPCAMAWMPGKEILLTATREGQMVLVDPVLGTRPLLSGVGETAVLAWSKDRSRVAAVSRDGTWRSVTPDGEVLHEGRHELLGAMDAQWVGDLLVLSGDTADGRVLLVLRGNEVRTRARLPASTAVLVDGETLLLARSLPEGLWVAPLRAGLSFPPVPPTGHRLRPAGRYVLGFTGSGVAVWGREGGAARSMRLPDLTAGDISSDGRWLALGTRSGAVALAALDRIDKRVHPDLVRAFPSAVTGVSFATRGKWLATLADSLRLWTWEEPTL